MKKVLSTLLFMFAWLALPAQDITLNENSVYEKKTVVIVENTSAAVLYGRAMEALSDWTGADGRSKAGIDFSDKDAGTVIYKGDYYLGFKKTILGAGWDRYADFTLKVRCKDGKAQVTVIVSSISGIYNKNGVKKTYTIREVVDITKKSKGKKKESREDFVSDIITTADAMVIAMTDRLKGNGVDDDF